MADYPKGDAIDRLSCPDPQCPGDRFLVSVGVDPFGNMEEEIAEIEARHFSCLHCGEQATTTRSTQ